MKNLVNTDWLYENIDNEDLILVDCRFDLQLAEYGKESYEKGHIKGAFFMDVNTDLSSEKKEHGGRHPLPDINVFKETVESIGINNNSIVVAYDDGDLAGASRLWWLLKYIGHEKVYVLNGGINKWINDGYDLVKDLPGKSKSTYTINLQNNILCDANEVKLNINKPTSIIIDSRSPERYTGEFEPVDKVGGHIPSAKNFFWQDVLDKNSQIKDKSTLENIFAPVKNYKEVIVYCGSGITGCVNFLALEEINIHPKLYAGSWSDWISYEENEIAKGN
ncbi:sulfurtransferase [Alkalithermobacter paradoxus]|uniref:3-mercaptopyruvate sulfurtransferase n=1 Tax=Alkalithermobacter paradoxus TaxID=29349 RepID=A0A1V4IB88_9FIRM|nr:3-mercaptopyruvate sulfurtransferase [[Clostridium] thermoalcaliphilum]